MEIGRQQTSQSYVNACRWPAVTSTAIEISAEQYGHAKPYSSSITRAPEDPRDQDPLKRNPDPMIQRVVQKPSEFDVRDRHGDIGR